MLTQTCSFDGASSDPKPAPRTYDGPPPEMVDGGKLYTGSCHCGAVQVALASKPLDESFPDGIGECNCSICERVRNFPEPSLYS